MGGVKDRRCSRGVSGREVRQKTVVGGGREGVLVVIGMRVCVWLRPCDETQLHTWLEFGSSGTTANRPDADIDFGKYDDHKEKTGD